MLKSSKMIYEAVLTVPFHDLDPLQVVWHGNYLKYFDIARFGLFHQAGIDLYRYYQDEHYMFPVTKTSTKYVFPLRYKDEFICRAKLIDANIVIAMEFEIRLADTQKLCARGKSEQVAVKVPEMEILLKIPDSIRNAFEVDA